MKAILCLVICAAPMLAFAADTVPDSSFYKDAAEAGIAEIDAGNLASEKATDPKLKEFAAMMVKDHSAANAKLQPLATSKGVKWPVSANVGQIATLAKLKLLSGETFDKSYIKGQVKAHKETVALLKKEIASGEDPDAKAFAKSTLPTVRAHLKAIDAIAAGAGVKE